MKKEDVKVGMRIKINASWFTGTGVVTDLDHDYFPEAVWVKCDGSTDDSWVSAQYIEPIEQPFSIANTKINVQKYAEENGITFEAACSEVYEWAVPQGYNWRNVSPVCTFSFLFTDTFVDKELTYSESRRYFDDHPNKEITLSRKVTVELTPSLVEPEKPAVRIS